MHNTVWLIIFERKYTENFTNNSTFIIVQKLLIGLLNCFDKITWLK